MEKRTFTDQMGEEVVLNDPPQRIISVVPSQSELLFYLGLDEKVIGITKFCIHPKDKFKTTVKIGGTKNLNIKLIKELKPDLIIGNKEENAKADIEELKKYFPVWMSDIYNLDDALNMINSIGMLTETAPKSQFLTTQIKNNFQGLNVPSLKGSLKAAYLIWQNPIITVGKQTFINDMLNRIGFLNVFDDFNRYPEITFEDLIQKKPQIILLSSEPYPFNKKHIDAFKTACPFAKVLLVDGEIFSWYGNRLLEFSAYIKKLKIEIQVLK